MALSCSAKLKAKIAVRTLSLQLQEPNQSVVRVLGHVFPNKLCTGTTEK